MCENKVSKRKSIALDVLEIGDGGDDDYVEGVCMYEFTYAPLEIPLPFISFPCEQFFVDDFFLEYSSNINANHNIDTQ